LGCSNLCIAAATFSVHIVYEGTHGLESTMPSLYALGSGFDVHLLSLSESCVAGSS